MTNYPLDTRVSHLESDMGATSFEIEGILKRLDTLEENQQILEKQIKKLTEQVDLNSQTLEALQ